MVCFSLCIGESFQMIQKIQYRSNLLQAFISYLNPFRVKWESDLDFIAALLREECESQVCILREIWQFEEIFSVIPSNSVDISGYQNRENWTDILVKLKIKANFSETGWVVRGNDNFEDRDRKCKAKVK